MISAKRPSSASVIAMCSVQASLTPRSRSLASFRHASTRPGTGAAIAPSSATTAPQSRSRGARAAASAASELREFPATMTQLPPPAPSRTEPASARGRGPCLLGSHRVVPAGPRTDRVAPQHKWAVRAAHISRLVRFAHPSRPAERSERERTRFARQRGRPRVSRVHEARLRPEGAPCAPARGLGAPTSRSPRPGRSCRPRPRASRARAAGPS